MSQAPFIVYSLPRSRSAWLTHFLSYPPRQAGHDVIVHCKKIEDFLSNFASGMAGTCETASVIGWRLIKRALPNAKLVVIKRPLGEVYLSLAQFGITPLLGELKFRDAMLDQVSALPGTLTYRYCDLDSPLACRAIFEHCLDLPFDWKWWEFLSPMNIQVDMQAQLDLLHKNHLSLQALRADVLARTKELPAWSGIN